VRKWSLSGFSRFSYANKDRFVPDSLLEGNGFELSVPPGTGTAPAPGGVCRLSGSGYAALDDLVSVERPQWQGIKGTIGMDAMPRAQRR
jgi:hypothetical protein